MYFRNTATPAFTTSTTDEAADGYYIVEWRSPPYLQGPGR